MKLYFWRGSEPNFGDELNTWLLPKVFPNFFDHDEQTLFLGIGSVLYDYHPVNCRKIVFGAGFGGYTPLPTFDENWDVYCVRGPRTAEACGFSKGKIAADAAILISRHRKRQRRSSRIAFMPHVDSIRRGRWQNACRLAGLHFIDPRGPVEEILQDIESSSFIVTEAMHGAIVADALRVPWIPALPLHHSHRLKWFDWAEALEIKLVPVRLYPSSTQEYKLDHPSSGCDAAGRCADAALTMLAAARLWYLARNEPMLSTDLALDRGLDCLETHATQIRKDFGRCL